MAVEDRKNIVSLLIASLSCPLHRLCVTHTCEVLDSGNLLVLKHVEEKVDLKNKIVKSMRSLQPFLSKGLIPAVITALSKLVSNDGLGNQRSWHSTRKDALASWDTVLLLFSTTEDLKNTLELSGSNNQLVQTCEMYLEIEYIEIAQRCVAWFTYKVTLPFLNV